MLRWLRVWMKLQENWTNDRFVLSIKHLFQTKKGFKAILFWAKTTKRIVYSTDVRVHFNVLFNIVKNIGAVLVNLNISILTDMSLFSMLYYVCKHDDITNLVMLSIE